MKILCLYSPGGSSGVRNGWRKCFQAAGHTFVFWDKSQKSAFDVFSEEEPDIFIGTTYDLDRATLKCFKSRPNLKVALFCSAYGDLTKEIDRAKFPIDIATEAELNLVKQLKDETGKPDFVFLHCVPSQKDRVIGGWGTLGIKTVSVLNACDTFEYLGGEFKGELTCDCSIVGGRWPYKSRNLDPFLMSLCNKYDFKVFGYGGWENYHNYLGQLDLGWEKHLFKSTKVCLSISEPHSTTYGYDLIERPFKVMGNGSFCLSDWVEGFNEVLGVGTLEMALTPAEYEWKLRFYLKNEDKRVEKAKIGQEKVLSGHTYWHRIAQMFTEFGLPEEAEKTNAMWRNLQKEVHS